MARLRAIPFCTFVAILAILPEARALLFTGFAGWVPGQLQSELARDDWFVLPASAELLFRDDTSGMWEELVRKARGRVAMR